MQRILNDPKEIVNDMQDGYLKCHKRTIERTSDPNAYVRKGLKQMGKRVSVVSGGGSGHLPAFIGYLRPGMLDAVAVGTLFLSPDENTFLNAFRAADMGKGIVCPHGNYQLDNKCISRAVEMAKAEGIEVRRIITRDEVSLRGRESEGRGLAGEVLLWKIAGAAAAAGRSLDEVYQITQYAADNMYSLGVALSACVIPEKGVPNFDIMSGTMVLGIGHHGEPGIETCKLRSASEIADLMMDEIFKTYSGSSGEKAAIMVSGLGGTTAMELYILYSRLSSIFEDRGIEVCRSYVGNYFTSLDMAGLTITVLRLNDELEKLLGHKEFWDDELT